MKTLRAYLAVPAIGRAVLLLLPALVLLAFVELNWRRPLTVSHESAVAAFEALRAEAAELRARIDSVATYADMESRIEDVAARFEAPVDRSGVVERLTALSSEAGTRIIHGANSFGRPRGDVIPVEQDLTIEGSYADVSRFLEGLQALDTLTLLRSADFSANPDGTLVRAKIKLVTLSAEAKG